MNEIWIVSDTHFGHANILKFKHTDGSLIRGQRFSSVEEMDEHMIERWNSVVRHGDKVYHLGDVFMGDGHSALKRLNGHKRLILGNHDNVKSPYLYNSFQKILMWRQFPEFNCVLSHAPLHESSLGFKVQYNVHGHTHDYSINDPRYFNVCVEKMDYTPIHMEDLIARLPPL